MRLRYKVLLVRPPIEYLGVEKEIVTVARCRELVDAFHLAGYVQGPDRFGRVMDPLAGPGRPLVYTAAGEPCCRRPEAPVPSWEDNLFSRGWGLAGVFYGDSPVYFREIDTSDVTTEARVEIAGRLFGARRSVSFREACLSPFAVALAEQQLLRDLDREVVSQTGALAFTGALTQTGRP